MNTPLVHHVYLAPYRRINTIRKRLSAPSQTAGFATGLPRSVPDALAPWLPGLTPTQPLMHCLHKLQMQKCVTKAKGYSHFCMIVPALDEHCATPSIEHNGRQPQSTLTSTAVILVENPVCMKPSTKPNTLVAGWRCARTQGRPRCIAHLSQDLDQTRSLTPMQRRNRNHALLES